MTKEIEILGLSVDGAVRVPYRPLPGEAMHRGFWRGLVFAVLIEAGVLGLLVLALRACA